MMFYRSIIKDSWKLAIRNKYLWFFGLFAAILGNGGEYEVFFRSTSNDDVSSWSGLASDFWMVLKNLPEVFSRFMSEPFQVSVIFFFYLLALLAFLFVVWMVNVSMAAIVDSNARQMREKDHDLKICLVSGIKNFWPVFAANLSVKVLIFFALLIMGLSVGSWLSALLFLIFVPSLIVASFISKFVIAYVVVRGEKLRDAFLSAIKLFRNNWIISLELAFILYMCTMLAGLVFMLLSFNVTKVFEVLVTFFPTSSFTLFVVVLPAVLLFCLALIGAVLAAFQISAWTKLFMELDSKGAISKIERMFSR